MTRRPSSRRRWRSVVAGRCTRWRGRSSASQRSPKRRRLEAVRVRHGDDEHALRAELVARGLSSASAGRGRCSSECQKTIAAKSSSSSCEMSWARMSGLVETSSSPIASRPRAAERVEERAVAGAHVEHAARRGDVVRRLARAPRERRSTASPGPAKRPPAGRYQPWYAALSVASDGHGSVIPAPHRSQRTRPPPRGASSGRSAAHHAQVVAGRSVLGAWATAMAAGRLARGASRPPAGLGRRRL